MPSQREIEACSRKLGQSRAAAIRAVNRAFQRGRAELKVYRCPVCRHYHTTAKSKLRRPVMHGPST